MSNLKKKYSSMIIACVALLLLLSACRQDIPQQTTQPTTESTEHTAPTVNISEKIDAVYDNCVSSVVQIRSGKETVGYGTILTADGYILTARQVVEGKSKFTVIFHDGSTKKATITDVAHDIAILKVNTKNLSPAVFPDKDVFIAGDIVFTLQEVSNDNLFSAVHGSIISPNQTTKLPSGMTEELIRTDIAIDKACSGAPLFDLNGNVIGIMNAQYPNVDNDVITYSHSIAVSKLQTSIDNMLGYHVDIEPDDTDNSDSSQDNSTDSVGGSNHTGSTSGMADKLTWEKINAIPVASNAMSEDQLRQICLDYMRLQLTFAWKPKETTTFSNSSSNTKTFSTDEIYGGIPYVTSSFGNIYKLMEFYDQYTGTLDLSGGRTKFKTIGNQCSAATFWAWNRVCNSLTYSGTSDALVKNGCLRVGQYKYDDSLKNFNKTTTQMICQSNGEQTMYESYAMLKPADGIVCSAPTGGHIRMISAKPNIVRNPDGTISGEQSTVTYMDQIASWSESKQSDGTPYEIEGGLDVVISFQKLYRDSYIPFTIAELNKNNNVEKGSASINHKSNTVAPAQLAGSKISANYAISSVRIIVTDAQGSEVYNKNTIATGCLYYSYSMSSFVDQEALQKLANNGCTLQVRTRIGNGEEVPAYTGTLVS